MDSLTFQRSCGPSVDSLCHPWFTTTHLSYRFPILETSATALCGTTGIIYIYIHTICMSHINPTSSNHQKWGFAPWTELQRPHWQTPVGMDSNCGNTRECKNIWVVTENVGYQKKKTCLEWEHDDKHRIFVSTSKFQDCILYDTRIVNVSCTKEAFYRE